MKKLSRLLALLLSLAMIISAAVISVQAVDEDLADEGADVDIEALAADVDAAGTAADSIIIHVDSPDKVPYIYYWNALPTNKETTYPGVKMSLDPTQTGSTWYTYSFNNTTKINFLLTDGTQNLSGQLSKELTRSSGEWWYRNGRFSKKNPYEEDDYKAVDMRQDTIYFVITTRFFDGDTGNNVHCWEDKKANNPDSDPAWRGDFKGLADKLDYIKALGFSAVWITPVAENASGYDYHGYHAMNFGKVDPRYESSDFTYEDLIAAAHDRGMKIVQDVVWNHTSNFGEEYLEKMFEKEYTNISDLGSTDCMKVVKGSNLEKAYPDYDSLNPDAQFQARLNVMKAHQGSTYGNTKEHYHREKNMGWGSWLEQQGSIAGDCVDVNTENPEVAEYITNTYQDYIDLGVDAFRLDTEKHLNRWTLNSAYFPKFAQYKQSKNFFIFGEVCTRWNEFMNEGGPSNSCFFYTWKETQSPWTSNWSNNPADWSQNNENSKEHFNVYGDKDVSKLPKSDNVYLQGLNYHTPDYSKANGTGVIDFTMHWNFDTAQGGWGAALSEDPYFNDSSWNVTYVDSHDYSPQSCQDFRYTGGTQAWAENLNLMFTFRGIPCLFYGSEVEFQKGCKIDDGPNMALADTGRAYFGDRIEGTVNTTGFSQYNNATGAMATTLNSTLSKHLQKLNAIRRAVPALQMGQYTTNGNYVSGGMSFIRRYTGNYNGKNVDSLACVSVTDGATFKNIPNGTYIDAVSGDQKSVTNGTLSVPSTGKGNMRVYVLKNTNSNVNGAIGPGGQTYLK